MLTRRTLVTASLPLLTLTTLAACGPNMAGSSGSDPGTVRFAWWGNPTRDELTRAAIDAYAEVAQDITVAAEPGEWDGYWDKLATQVAGGDCPDVLQMDESYLAESASRGIHLDLGRSRRHRHPTHGRDGRGHLRRPAVRHRRRPAAVRLPAPARCREVQRGGRPRLCGGGSPAVDGARAAPPGDGRRALRVRGR